MELSIKREQVEPSEDSAVNQTSPGLIFSPDGQGHQSPNKVTSNDGDSEGIGGFVANGPCSGWKSCPQGRKSHSGIILHQNRTPLSSSTPALKEGLSGCLARALSSSSYMLQSFQWVSRLWISSLSVTRMCFTEVIFSSLSFKVTRGPVSVQCSGG